MHLGAGPDVPQTSSDHHGGKFLNSAQLPCLIGHLGIIAAVPSPREPGISGVGVSDTLCGSPPK